MSDLHSMASQLYRRAVSVLAHLAELDQDAPLAALDAFVAQPAASTFLAASRALNRAQRHVRLERLRNAGAGHGFQRGMAALARVPAVDGYLVQQLSGVPVDSRAGKRLEALAALMGAHHELASRAEAASQALRAQHSSMARKTKPARSKRAAIAPRTAQPPKPRKDTGT